MQYVDKHNKEKEEEHKFREEQFNAEKESKSKKKKKIIWIAAVIIVLTVSAITYASLSTGKYDKFAKCLTEKGAVMYGEDWCQYTQGQKAMFGKSFKYVDYQVKTDLKLRPTWVIDDKTYETVQSFDRLAFLTGCEY